MSANRFHVVQIFTTALEQVRRAEAHQHTLPRRVRWATLKRPENLTAAQQRALDELETGGFATAEAYRAKEMLRWVRQAATPQAARWRLTNFLNHVTARLDAADHRLDPVRQAVDTVRRNANRIIRRWLSGHSNARLEALNGLFQAARARARGYRNTATFTCIIYLIGAPSRPCSMSSIPLEVSKSLLFHSYELFLNSPLYRHCAGELGPPPPPSPSPHRRLAVMPPYAAQR